MKRLGLSRIRTRVLMLALLPATILVVVLAFYFTATRVADLHASFQERGTIIAEQLAALSVYGVFTGNIDSLKKTTQTFMQRDDLVLIRLRDPIGNTLLDLSKGNGPSGRREALTPLFEQFTAAIYAPTLPGQVSDYPDSLENDAASAKSESIPIGYVTVGLVNENIYLRQREIITNIILLTLGGLIVTSFVALAWSRKITQPLERMTDMVRRIGEGQLDATVPTTSTGELGELERGINAMAKQLSAFQSSLQEQIDVATSDLMQTMEALEIKNVEIDLTRKQAQQANAAKSEFLANVSHEIRTPMNGIVGFLKLLRQTELTDSQKEYIETIEQSTASLLEIINDILDFSKLEAGELALESSDFDIFSCMENSISLLAPVAHEKGLELVILIYDDVPRFVVGDRTRIRQIVINLVSNAIKFTANGTIVVRVMLDEETDSQCSIILSVEDSGIGIPEEMQKVIFSPFHQGRSSGSWYYGGTGLGLSITKKLATMMGGNVTVRSHVGEGSTFEVTLALPKCTNIVQHNEASFPPELRFILFDTHDLPGLAIQHRLNRIASTVLRCTSEKELYELLQDNRDRHAIVVLGFSSTDIDRQMHTRLIEKIKDLCDLPLVVLVSSSEKSVLDGIRGMGIALCLSKPVMQETLYRHLRSLILQYFPGMISEGEITPISQSPHAPLLNGLKVLVADDNEINRKLISELVSMTGADVTVAHDGTEVIKLLKYTTYDVFLIDLRMPKLDGFATSQKIREMPVYAHTLIVALTADGAPENRSRALDAGMNECLIKPIDEKVLWQILEAAKDGGFQGALTDAGDAEGDQKPLSSDRRLPSRDIEAAIKIAGKNEELAEEIFTSFCEDLPLQMEEVKRLYEQESWAELSETAHRMRGSTRFCALPALDYALTLLEQASEKKESRLIAECIEDVKYEVARLLRSVPSTAAS